MISHSPCGAPGCYRGGIDDYNYQYKDGPCGAERCQWPKDLETRPHFTDTPAKLVIEEGRHIWKW